MRILLLIIASFFLLTSCEKVIEVDLEEGEKHLVVDAFLTNQSETQNIKLSLTQPYFENTTPPPVVNATVRLLVGKDTLLFKDLTNTGNYSANGLDKFLRMNNTCKLQVLYDNSIYEATSILHPAPSVDTLLFGPATNENGQPKEGMTAEFYAFDFEGIDDYYRIKHYINDVPATPINLSVNGAMEPGADGIMFIIPVRFSINSRDKTYALGDKLKVEIHSITRNTWEFFRDAQTQLNNAGLFATPPANTRCNITKVSGNGYTPVGWFSVSAVSARTQIVK